MIKVKSMERNHFFPKGKFLDFLVVFSLLFCAAALILTFQIRLMGSVLLYLGLPSLFLIWRESKPLKEIVLASTVFGLFLGMVYDFAAEYHLAYATHYRYPLLDEVVIGKTPIGDFVWAFLIPFSIFVFYEHFVDDDRVWEPGRRHWFAVITSALVFVSGVTWFWIFPDTPVHPFSYLIVGAISVLPLIGMFFVSWQLIQKILLCGSYFAVLNLVFEVTARMLGHWSFDGVYLGDILFAGVSFPIEELLFWIVPSAVVFLFLYELVFDDRK